MPLAALKELGVRIAIDDFGTGYSSLAYLTRFPVDTLKVDKSFVDGLGTGNAEDATIAHAIVTLAHTLHLDVVAEGIEHASQRDDLRSMGCQYGQGYLYSKPVTPDQFDRLIAQPGHLGPPLVTQISHAPRLLNPATHPDPVRHLAVARRPSRPTLIDTSHATPPATCAQADETGPRHRADPGRPA